MPFYTIDLEAAKNDATASADQTIIGFVKLLPQKVSAKLEKAKNCVDFNGWFETIRMIGTNKGLTVTKAEPNITLTSGGGASITLKLIELTGVTVQKFSCSNCGLGVGTIMDLSPAHNVVPSALWKKIISSAISRVVHSNTGLGSDVVRSIDVLCDALRSGKRKGKAEFDTFAFTGITSIAVTDKDWDFMLRLLATGEKTGYSSSTSRELGQCGACEQLQKDYSLIQRNRACSGGTDITDLNVRFVGKVYMLDPGSAVTSAVPKLHPEDHILELTEKAVQDVLPDMEEQVRRGCNLSELAKLLHADIDSFKRAIEWFAVLVASEPRPDIGAHLVTMATKM